MPRAHAHDYRDVGGRATQDAKAEEWRVSVGTVVGGSTGALVGWVKTRRVVTQHQGYTVLFQDCQIQEALPLSDNPGFALLGDSLFFERPK
jgi:hypothetical protein